MGEPGAGLMRYIVKLTFQPVIMESEERRERRARTRQDSYGEPARRRGARKSGASVWLWFGVGILILLLLVWLTIADFWGDTDVAAMISLP